jgi:hypothetical protein
LHDGARGIGRTVTTVEYVFVVSLLEDCTFPETSLLGTQDLALFQAHVYKKKLYLLSAPPFLTTRLLLDGVGAKQSQGRLSTLHLNEQFHLD